MFVTGIVFAFRKQNPFANVPKTGRIDVIMRSLAGQLTFALENYSFTMLPMAVALIMIATNPFWVIIIALCMFRDKILPIEIVGIMVCLGGVAILVYSEHYTALEEYEEEVEKGEATEEEYKPELHIYEGMFVAFIAAWTFALYNTYNFRKLKDRDSVQLIFIEACLGFVIFSLIIVIEFIFFGENEFRIYSGTNYGFILGACALDTVAFYF